VVKVSITSSSFEPSVTPIPQQSLPKRPRTYPFPVQNIPLYPTTQARPPIDPTPSNPLKHPALAINSQFPTPNFPFFRPHPTLHRSRENSLCCVKSSPYLFFNVTRCLEYLSSGENLAGCALFVTSPLAIFFNV
jgi:hypothetical protein